MSEPDYERNVRLRCRVLCGGGLKEECLVDLYVGQVRLFPVHIVVIP